MIQTHRSIQFLTRARTGFAARCIGARHRFSTLCASALAGLLVAAAPVTHAATFPDKPITMYVAFAAGGTTDITARALAQGMEKILGVPVAVENKGGGGATVANGLLASKKPDGYSLLATSTGSITVRPLLMKLAYTATSFRVLMQYTLYVGSLTVRTDAPWKNIDEFIDYARKNPGMTYSSSGPHTQQQVAVESFAMCKNLKFKHVPTKGGSTANTALLGGHVDFVAGSGSHLPLVEQGSFRELLIFHRDERDPKSPTVPIMKDIGCPPTNPANGMIIVAPAGLPDAVAARINDALRQTAQSPEFRQLLEKYNLPYAYEEGSEVQKKFPAEIAWYRKYFTEMGLLKN
jgi:tripartite-type tricarboxylate transporter receptor subunit TctC